MMPALASLWLSLASFFGADPCMGPVTLTSTGEDAQTCPVDPGSTDTGKDADAQAPVLPPVHTISNGF